MLRLQFKMMQKHFDKKYRYSKRLHHKNEYTNLETNAKDDPAAMWKALKRLNNPPTTKAALEIIRDDKSISADIKEVLERWYDDISSLFSGLHEDPELACDDDFYREVLKKKKEFEDMIPEEQVTCSEYDSNDLNDALSYDEMSEAINKSKFKKSYLEIPNEVLKNKNSKLLLFNFFQLCFQSGLNPADWDYSDIVPIP